jgi:hypothetical protein
MGYEVPCEDFSAEIARPVRQADSFLVDQRVVLGDAGATSIT